MDRDPRWLDSLMGCRDPRYPPPPPLPGHGPAALASGFIVDAADTDDDMDDERPSTRVGQNEHLMVEILSRTNLATLRSAASACRGYRRLIRSTPPSFWGHLAWGDPIGASGLYLPWHATADAARLDALLKQMPQWLRGDRERADAVVRTALDAAVASGSLPPAAAARARRPGEADPPGSLSTALVLEVANRVWGLDGLGVHVAPDDLATTLARAGLPGWPATAGALDVARAVGQSIAAGTPATTLLRSHFRHVRDAAVLASWQARPDIRLADDEAGHWSRQSRDEASLAAALSDATAWRITWTLPGADDAAVACDIEVDAARAESDAAAGRVVLSSRPPLRFPQSCWIEFAPQALARLRAPVGTSYSDHTRLVGPRGEEWGEPPKRVRPRGALVRVEARGSNGKWAAVLRVADFWWPEADAQTMRLSHATGLYPWMDEAPDAPLPHSAMAMAGMEGESEQAAGGPGPRLVAYVHFEVALCSALPSRPPAPPLVDLRSLVGPWRGAVDPDLAGGNGEPLVHLTLDLCTLQGRWLARLWAPLFRGGGGRGDGVPAWAAIGTPGPPPGRLWLESPQAWTPPDGPEGPPFGPLFHGDYLPGRPIDALALWDDAPAVLAEPPAASGGEWTATRDPEALWDRFSALADDHEALADLSIRDGSGRLLLGRSVSRHTRGGRWPADYMP